ncbi:hypothetical protein ACWGJ2_07815 [Streptomyces sp. NPDC054796]
MTGQDLPLPDYDELPAASIEHRVRPLSREDVNRLLEHERGHAGRPQVTEVLAARLRELDRGAEPTPGDAEGARPDRPEPGRGGSPVSPDSAREPSKPFRHGEREM